MKKILITGANSYIGTNVEKWLMREPYKYYVETLDMKNPNWKDFDFSKFDVIFHVAGIAHVSKKKSLEELYYKVNRDLTIETAKKAKESGVGQFIFMSSMIVYNSKETKISFGTNPNPDNFYGLSKLQAEQGLQNLETKNFKVSIIRPPMIYGPNSKGNFPRLLKFANKTFIFPKFNNKRSMLFIDNLSNSIKNIIDKSAKGIFYPQNSEYVSTSDLIKRIKLNLNKKIYLISFFNPLIRLLRNRISIINKLFSDSFYDFEMSENMLCNNLYNLDQSISKTLSNN